MKTCSRCAATRPAADFHMKGGGYRRPECKDCFNASRPRAHKRTLGSAPPYREDKAAYQRYYKYGLTPAEYSDMLTSQDSTCAICGSEEPGASDWQVDHDHASGRVRGLLCRSCNIALGLMRDDISRMHRAIEYLQALR